MAALADDMKEPLPGYLYYACVLIQHHNRGPGEDTLHASIRKAAADYLSGCGLSHRVTTYQGHICCLLHFGDYNLRVLAKALIQVLYATVEDCDFNLYYSRPSVNTGELEQNAAYLAGSLGYTFLRGYAQTLAQDYLEECDRNPSPADEHAVPVLRKLLAEKQCDALCAYLREKSEEIKKGYSCHSADAFLEAAFYTLKTFFLDKSFSHELNSLTLAELRSRTGNADAFTEYLCSCAQEYQCTLQEAPCLQNQRYLEAIKQYVDCQLATVTLSSLAKEFRVTPAHLSRLFRKNTGITLTEYISEKKLELAAELLVSDADMNINEISKRLGYGSPSYFLTKFKERYGVTPSAYRKNRLTQDTKERQTN